MSAIAGVFHFDGSAGALNGLSAGLAAMGHRGPDGRRAWHDESAAVGHLLLRTGEEQGGLHQLARASSGNVCAADARLDNRIELLSVLSPSSGRDRLTDAELILLAYERWGTACLKRLIGDFAFVVWDAADRSVFCGRDPMGVRPLYYFRCARVFAVATELVGLLALEHVSDKPDVDRIRSHLAWQERDRERTFFADVRRLPAAHWMRVSNHRDEQRQYWHIRDSQEVLLGSDAEYAEAFLDCFSRSVEARLPKGAPVAAALSGGLDSSAIVCLARTLVPGVASRLHTTSLVFPGMDGADLKRIDERPFIKAVSREGGFTTHLVRGDIPSPLGHVDETVLGLGEPYSAPNLFLHQAMYTAAHGTGSRTFLDGFDGDSTISHGLGRLDDLLSGRRWDVFENEVREFAGHRHIDPASVLDHYGIPHVTRSYQSRSWLSWFATCRQLHSRFGVSRKDLVWKHSLRSKQLRPPHASRESHIQGLDQPLYQSTLELADCTAGLSGIQPCYPFFDRRLIEFCVGIPPEQKMSGGWTRVVFRRAMEGILPPTVQWRATKANLSPAFRIGFSERDREVLAAADLSMLEDYTNISPLLELRRRMLVEQQSIPKADAFLLFRATTLSIWLQHRAAGAWHRDMDGNAEATLKRVSIFG